MNYLKNILLLMVLVTVVATGVLAQNVPQSFKYQVILRDSEGDPIRNDDAKITIEILEGSATGTVVFTEDHWEFTNDYGLINIQIGSENDLGVIDWGAEEYFIRVSVDDDEYGTSQLLSVPYALYALDAAVEFDERDLEYNLDGNMAQWRYEGDSEWNDMFELPEAGDVDMPEGTQQGEILMWDGSDWVLVIPGSVGQVLTINPDGDLQWVDTIRISFDD